MREPWIYVGRLWTNGDLFLAVDAELRGAWHGFNDDEYQQIIPLGWQVTSIPVGTGRALLVGADGVVRDDSWMEVFQSQAGGVAIVQASGPDYREALARALAYQIADDQDGDELEISSGEIAIFSAADDGTGPYSGPLGQGPAWAGAGRSRQALARGGPRPPDLSPAHRVQAQGPVVHQAR